MLPIVSICDLRKSYADGSEALKGVSLDIERERSLPFSGQMELARRP